MESTRLKEIAIATVGLVIALVFLVFFLLSRRSFGVSAAAPSTTPPGSIAPQVLGVEFTATPSTNTQFVLLPGETSIVTARVTAPGSTVSISGPTAIRTELQTATATATATAFRTVTPHPAPGPPTVTKLLLGPTATATVTGIRQVTQTDTATLTQTQTQTQTQTATKTVTPAPVTQTVTQTVTATATTTETATATATVFLLCPGDPLCPAGP